MNSSMQLHGTLGDLLFLVCFLAAALIPFATYVCLCLLGLVSLPAAKDGGAGRRLLGPLFVGFYYWLLGPFLRLAKRSGLAPNHFTLASLVASVPTGLAIASGHFAIASVLLVLGSTLDVVDGHVARDKHMATPAGAFLDSTVDRVCDGMILGGCAVYYAGTSTMIAAMVALVMSFATSYARARGEALGVSGSEGLIQRADRLVILGLALALSPYLGHRAEGFVPHPSYAVARAALWLLAVLSTFTAASRTVWIARRLRPGRTPPVRSPSLPAPAIGSWLPATAPSLPSLARAEVTNAQSHAMDER
jgi:CDP-diacylglycerol--glycerol-3-phosphate 3-phosphatidyltransferase